MKKFLLNLVSPNSKISSKRVITLLAFIMMSIGYIANLFWGCTLDPALNTSMEYITIAGLGFTASEKFANKKKSADTPNEEIIN